jgi:hypothetical protein
MRVKFASAKIVEVKERFPLKNISQGVLRRLATVDPIRLDPERYLYVRNRAISALETWGANDNGDAFPRDELKKSHLTFIGSRVSLDHDEHLRIGMVLDSVWIPYNESTQDGDYVENILALDKKVCEAVFPGLIQAIVDRKITDTSMGVYVDYSTCSVCGNRATAECEFCEHIRYAKGSKVRLANGQEVPAYEINYGLTFFEDSVIVPSELGGRAGGRGADPNAKMLERMATKLDLDPFIRNPLILVGDNKPGLPVDQKYQPGYVNPMPSGVGMQQSDSPLGDFPSGGKGHGEQHQHQHQHQRGKDPDHKAKMPVEKVVEVLGAVAYELEKHAKNEDDDKRFDEAFNYIMYLTSQGYGFEDAMIEAEAIFWLNGGKFPQFLPYEDVKVGDRIDVDGVVCRVLEKKEDDVLSVAPLPKGKPFDWKVEELGVLVYDEIQDHQELFESKMWERLNE